MTVAPVRPTGVTILAILSFIGAAIAACFGVLILALAGLAGAAGVAGGSTGVGTIFAGLGLLGSIVMFGMAGLSVVVGIGLLRLRNWARLLTIALCGLGIVLSVLGLLIALASFRVGGIASALIRIGLNGLIIWYLMQPHVIAAFAEHPPAVMVAQS